MTLAHTLRKQSPATALVLAAGYGNRLAPYSTHTPKPLFTLNSQPLLDIMIRRLIAAGIRTVIVNTHHLHQQIEAFIQGQSYPAAIVIRHEPEILGTGGAIRNTADVWRPHSLLVVNSDIVTDIDFPCFFRFHRRHRQPVSLALCEHAAFNSVMVDHDGGVVGFRKRAPNSDGQPFRRLTFTGIQILEKDILDYLPPQGFASSIDAFEAMIAAGRSIRAYRPEGLHWSDLGTPERYAQAARHVMTKEALKRIGVDHAAPDARWWPLPGDGSDRRWYRLTAAERSLVVADHGIKPGGATSEAEAFVAIGRHLHRRGLPVPEIVLADPFAGLVFMKDLGDENFQARIQATGDPAAVEADYRRVIDLLIEMGLKGGDGFDPAWAYQTPRYDRDVVIDRECRYFVNAFLNGHLAMDVPFERLEAESRRLAAAVTAVRPLGFMHRDFQSRNIMVQEGRFYIIDFQAGRIGPPHYDLAALLVDPYVDLPFALRERLLGYFARRLASCTKTSSAAVHQGYVYCALARNLQILGAFAHLTRQKNKPFFAQFMAPALRSLQQLLDDLDPGDFPVLSRLVRHDIPLQMGSGSSSGQTG